MSCFAACFCHFLNFVIKQCQLDIDFVCKYILCFYLLWQAILQFFFEKGAKVTFYQKDRVNVKVYLIICKFQIYSELLCEVSQAISNLDLCYSELCSLYQQKW
ncbi:hypothetical protein V8G54_032594 [Vigna mungo]|uniref:Uncharacterized protein n=1 Tax=Vigna mungo TaxID=3915 RepID=A0AAQ3RGU6_VIGMU